MAESLYIVMPVYNEIENITDVIEEWYPILQCGNDDSRLVLACDGSTDGTDALAERLSQSDYPKIAILKGTDRWHGPKVLALYRHAIEQNVDWIFQTDSDGQTRASEFAQFWDARSEYDVIIGIRPKRGDGIARKFVEFVLCRYLHAYFKVNVPDSNAPYRLMKSDVVNKYIDLMPADYNIPNAVFTACFKRYGEKLLFLPISFSARQKGKNTINLRRIAGIGIKAFGGFRQVKRAMLEMERAKANVNQA